MTRLPRGLWVASFYTTTVAAAIVVWKVQGLPAPDVVLATVR